MKYVVFRDDEELEADVGLKIARLSMRAGKPRLLYTHSSARNWNRDLNGSS